MNFLPRAWADEQTQRNHLCHLEKTSRESHANLVTRTFYPLCSVCHAKCGVKPHRDPSGTIRPQSQSAIENYKKLTTLENYQTAPNRL